MVITLPVPVTDEQLYQIGEANPGWKVELIGGKVIMSPTNSDAGRRNAALTFILVAWARGHGYVAFDSSTGFKLSKDDALSPNGALIHRDRWNGLTKEQQRSYAPVAPDVVVELISSPDDAHDAHDAHEAHEKCERWIAFGSKCALALNPYATDQVRTWGTPPEDFPTDWSEVVD